MRTKIQDSTDRPTSSTPRVSGSRARCDRSIHPRTPRTSRALPFIPAPGRALKASHVVVDASFVVHAYDDDVHGHKTSYNTLYSHVHNILNGPYTHAYSAHLHAPLSRGPKKRPQNPPLVVVVVVDLGRSRSVGLGRSVGAR